MIPFSQLYNFLDKISKLDLLIYRFFPAGSKNLEDCQPLQAYYTQKNLVSLATTPYAIFHDQEPLDFQRYTDLYDWVNQHQVAAKNALPYWPFEMVDIVAQSNLRACTKPFFVNVFDQTILVHSEQRSKNLKKYQDNGFVDAYYWSHALIARDWYRYSQIDPDLVGLQDFEYDFLVYSRAWSGTREYRLKFLEELLNHDLNKCVLGKFSPVDNQLHYSQHVFQNKSFTITVNDIENYFAENTTHSDASASYSSDDYAQAAIDIVLETLFDDDRLHLTEKILRPIACGKPFVLLATNGSLEYLRSYGFRTFQGIIDESYDTIVDPKQRLDAVIQLLKEISRLDSRSKKVLYKKLYDVAQYNQQHFHSQEFINTVIQEYCTNINRAYQNILDHRTGKNWQQFHKIYARHPEGQQWQLQMFENNIEDFFEIWKFTKNLTQ